MGNAPETKEFKSFVSPCRLATFTHTSFRLGFWFRNVELKLFLEWSLTSPASGFTSKTFDLFDTQKKRQSLCSASKMASESMTSQHPRAFPKTPQIQYGGAYLIKATW